MGSDTALREKAKLVGELLESANANLSTAESCTGGWIAESITDIPGSSAWFDRAFVTYSNEAKISMLDIDPKVIETYGAVSQQTAEQMARGAIRQSGTTWAVAVTGIAGPGGGTDEKPVGTVWIAWAERENPHVVAKCQRFLGDRTAVRRQTVLYALDGLIAALSRP